MQVHLKLTVLTINLLIVYSGFNNDRKKKKMLERLSKAMITIYYGNSCRAP